MEANFDETLHDSNFEIVAGNEIVVVDEATKILLREAVEEADREDVHSLEESDEYADKIYKAWLKSQEVSRPE